MGRDAGNPLREVAFTQQIATSTVDFTFNFSDGSPPIHTQTTWGTTMQSRAGRGIAPWELELSDARELERKEQLRKDKKFIIYRGAARAEAVEDIRNIFRASMNLLGKCGRPSCCAKCSRPAA